MTTPVGRELPYAIRQFEIERIIAIELFGVDISFTNSASAMLTTVVVIALFFLLALRRPRIVPGRLQAAAEYIVDFIRDTVRKNGGPHALGHLPVILTLYLLILFGCLIGLTPFKFTFTSHIIVTFALAMFVFIYVTVLGVRLHGAGFMRQFSAGGDAALHRPAHRRD